MHGYEAAYQVEKERRKTGEEKTGFLPDFICLLNTPISWVYFVWFLL